MVEDVENVLKRKQVQVKKFQESEKDMKKYGGKVNGNDDG